MEAGKQQQRENMVSGTAWLSLANVLSRFLGAAYIIPWYAWMAPFSNQANALFSMGYNVYALFLLLSTIGIPVAIAKEVAHYTALGQEATAYRLVRQILLFMMGLGVIAALVMYFAAPALAAASGGGTALTPVMRSLALSILIFPAMSVIRGLFQGLSEMRVFALSQIYEQIIRIIWMLVATYWIMQLGNKNWEEAVTQSTTAAFYGMLASLAILFYFLIRYGFLTKLVRPSLASSEVSDLQSMTLLRRTITAAVPFMITGSAIQVFKLIDQLSFATIMHWVTNYSDTQLSIFFSYFSANTDKITMILIGTALTLGDVGLPLITAAYAKNKKREVAYLISYNLQFFAAFMLPAVIGVVLLARPIYVLFYGTVNSLQLWLFIFAAFQSILLTLLSLAWLFLQAMHYSRTAIKHFGWTLAVKFILQIPMIAAFQSYGPLIATSIAFLFGCYITLSKIRRVSHFSPKKTWRGIFGIALLTLLMAIVVVFFNLIFALIFRGRLTHLTSLIIVLISGGTGLYTYLFLSAKLGFLEKFLGLRGTTLRRRLHI